jgi:serine/threonine-protein kinase RsbW
LLRLRGGIKYPMAAIFGQDYPQGAQCLQNARRDVAQFATLCGFESNEVDEVVLAVGEAVGNVIEHSGSSRSFSLCCENDGERLLIKVADCGKGYIPVSLPVSAPELGSRGLGIYLMTQLMDKVEFSMNPSIGGTTLRLEKKLLGQSLA